ncbi:hypothetical protein VP01_921g6 [Puccinia sorghi]|uniref:Uncharacterized protein n=1 Tax=Puccinia sorghi TaxID=27349 RepID=A0A0L6U7A4_9BASI|nr:hypothetical protein VP01_921g6 [Puccinia sorghi]
MAHIQLSPVVLMKHILDNRDDAWKNSTFSAGYVENTSEAITAVQKIICKLLKYEKRTSTKWRRQEMLQKSKQRQGSGLHTFALKCLYTAKTYKRGYAQLVLDFDAELFNDKNTGKHVSKLAVVLPSEDEVKEMNTTK